MNDPYDNIVKDIERQMQRVSDDILMHMFRMSGASGEIWTPRVDIYETSDNVVVKVCVAGLEPDQMELSLSVDGRYLTLRGIRTEQDNDKSERTRYHQLEVYYGPFERTVALPQGIPIDKDRLDAVYKDGFLKVILPKIKESKRVSIVIDC